MNETSGGLRGAASKIKAAASSKVQGAKDAAGNARDAAKSVAAAVDQAIQEGRGLGAAIGAPSPLAQARPATRTPGDAPADFEISAPDQRGAVIRQLEMIRDKQTEQRAKNLIAGEIEKVRGLSQEEADRIAQPNEMVREILEGLKRKKAHSKAADALGAELQRRKASDAEVASAATGAVDPLADERKELQTLLEKLRRFGASSADTIQRDAEKILRLEAKAGHDPEAIKAELQNLIARGVRAADAAAIAVAPKIVSAAKAVEGGEKLLQQSVEDRAALLDRIDKARDQLLRERGIDPNVAPQDGGLGPIEGTFYDTHAGGTFLVEVGEPAKQAVIDIQDRAKRQLEVAAALQDEQKNGLVLDASTAMADEAKAAIADLSKNADLIPGIVANLNQAGKYLDNLAHSQVLPARHKALAERLKALGDWQSMGLKEARKQSVVLIKDILAWRQDCDDRLKRRAAVEKEIEACKALSKDLYHLLELDADKSALTKMKEKLPLVQAEGLMGELPIRISAVEGGYLSESETVFAAQEKQIGEIRAELETLRKRAKDGKTKNDARLQAVAQSHKRQAQALQERKKANEEAVKEVDARIARMKEAWSGRDKKQPHDAGRYGDAKKLAGKARKAAENGDRALANELMKLAVDAAKEAMGKAQEVNLASISKAWASALKLMNDKFHELSAAVKSEGFEEADSKAVDAHLKALAAMFKADAFEAVNKKLQDSRENPRVAKPLREEALAITRRYLDLIETDPRFVELTRNPFGVGGVVSAPHAVLRKFEFQYLTVLKAQAG